MFLGLAPMDGFTDCAFRQITKEIFAKYGEHDKYELMLWTEFMNADGYIINPLGVIKHLMTTQEQTPVIAQIFGANEAMLINCFTDIQTKYGASGELKVDGGALKKNSSSSTLPTGRQVLHPQVFSGIELNMGCPARNVMNTGGGSALLKDRKTTLALIKKLSGVSNIPFSIKTRTGTDDNDLKDQMEFLVQASAYVSMISIHGRTVRQGYAADAQRDFVYELKEKADKKCKIIGNGGIKTYEQIAHHATGRDKSYSDFDFYTSSDQLEEKGLITDGKYLPYDPSLQERARELRKHMTPAEQKIWKQCFKFLDINILRQKVIDHYIVDFYIPSKRLVIEIDGDTHFTQEAEGYDEARTKILEAYGLEVIRITNDDVYNHFDGVCEVIENRITPNPSLAKRGAFISSSFAKGGARREEDSLIDGVMIGQAAIGNPRIFTPHTPSRAELKETILKHLDYMISYEVFFQAQKPQFTGILAMPPADFSASSELAIKFIIPEFRKHLFQYVKGIPGSKEFKQKVSTIIEYQPLVEAVQEFFS